MTDAKKTTILVVDDSRVSRMLSRQFILELHPDWQIEEAASGEEALTKLDTVAMDLIIMDVNMPGMGGIAAVQAIRDKQFKTPICLLTANIQDATRDRAHGMGVGFAEKPITEARIRQILSVLEDV